MARSIKLKNVVVSDPTGKVTRKYRRVEFDSECMSKEGGRINKDMELWMLSLSGTKKTIPSLPLLYGIIERLYDQQHEGLEGLRSDIQEGAHLCTSTLLDYRTSTIIHGYGVSDAYGARLPFPASQSTNLVHPESQEWDSFLQALFFTNDVSKAGEILQESFGLEPLCGVRSPGEDFMMGSKAYAHLFRGRGEEYQDKLMISCVFPPFLGGNVRAVQTKKSLLPSALETFVGYIGR